MLRDEHPAHVAIALAEEQRDGAGREQRLKTPSGACWSMPGSATACPSDGCARSSPRHRLNAQGLGIWLARRRKTSRIASSYRQLKTACMAP